MPTHVSPPASRRELAVFVLIGAVLLALALPAFERKLNKLKHQARSIRNAETHQAEFQASQTPLTRLNP